MEEALSHDEGFDENLEVNFSEAPNPYKCTLQINVPRGDGDILKKLYSPLLEGMDPTFQFISIDETDDVDSSQEFWNTENVNNEDSSYLQFQAISVALFLYEAFGRLSALDVQKNFQLAPWKFHHRIELPVEARPRVVAQQDFYQTLPGLPLWSICPVHYGNEHLRFHLLTRNFPEMRSFYEMLTAKKATCSSPGFCYIVLYCQSGFDIQLSFKYLPQICPKSSKAARLKFKIKDISLVVRHLVEPPILREEALWTTRDPDGNEVIIEETGPSLSRMNARLLSNVSSETSDYETASLETESLSGSLSLSPSETLNLAYSGRFSII